MAVSPLDFLASARELLARPESEERHWRAAIHAAYYAAFHAIRNQLPSAPLGASEHRWIREQLKIVDLGSANRSVRIARRTFGRLWDLRRSADYDLTHRFHRSDASFALASAAQIVSG